MVVSGGSFATRALSLLAARADDYKRNARASTNVVQQWYNSGNGLWDTTGWWNSGNILTTLGDFARISADADHRTTIVNAMANTFNRAQQTSNSVIKTTDTAGLVHTAFVETNTTLEERGFNGFINDYYDDEGWWALAWIRAYDVTADPGYLDMAVNIARDMTGGVTSSPCGGGIWWSKAKTYKNAIANELYLAVLASLANRVSGQKDHYVSLATAQWTWFKNSGMINSDGTINDGLKINSDNTCSNNGGIVFSYNQGVVLGGLTELAVATGNTNYVTSALSIARAAMSKLSVNGILHDQCDLNGGSCGGDGNQFKGIFVRNLGYLSQYKLLDAATRSELLAYIDKNAESIWKYDYTAGGKLSLSWSGSNIAPTAATHGSAMDCIVAAANYS